MNYLAHMFLSERTPASMLGNLLGDFVKGPVAGKFPEEVVQGIHNHRKVDAFTDSNSIVSASKKLISSTRARYAGIIVDVLYDHFLSLNWGRYSEEKLRDFIRSVYQNLQRHQVAVPQRVHGVIERMAREDWLGSYRTKEGLDLIFTRMAQRLKRDNELADAADELTDNYEKMNDQFNEFFPLVVRFVREDRHPKPDERKVVL